ncbi:Bcr/CflA family efflux MFS transporter [Francisella sp. SYW-9]|uniref:Bcr/CflA family efflux MFS transporter n=1 Tax=Francisella sp. SYW-9 TaxID=2610888 RepID=UPI00123D1AA5|nr:Bcr/CflA family efflux MFS transporter [Francisella sp. SYW-9]
MYQLRKGSKYLVFFVVIFVALPPFAIDTYIPAFGSISSFFQIDVSILSITISTYLIGFGVGMVFWGALSDRFGRKNILIIGMLIYVLSTILCSFTHNFDMLIFMRFMQGLGDSPAAIAASAILKDCYRGQKLIKMMATMAMIFMIAPIVAPIIGSVIIYMTGRWQDIFHFLTIYGIILVIISFTIPETLMSKNRSKSLPYSFKVYFKHLINPPFIITSIASGLCFGAFFSFISSSSNLIIGYYKLGYIGFCILFALNICGVVLASYYIKNKINSSNEKYFIFMSYASVVVILIANIISSTYLNNIYLFIILNAFATISFSLINIITTTKAIDLLKEGFAAGNAIVRLLRFIAAGFAGFLISFSSISNLMIEIPIQQLGFVILSILIFMVIKNRLFPVKT